MSSTPNGKVQRGCIIAKNEFGTLERVDGTNTCVGTTTLTDGKVLTKRFRGSIADQKNLIARWEKWQGRKAEDEEPMDERDISMTVKETEKKIVKGVEKAPATCPFSNVERACNALCPIFSTANNHCAIHLGGIGLYNIAANYLKMDPNESLELIALAISELNGEKSKAASSTSKKVKDNNGVEDWLKTKNFLSFVNLTTKKVYGEYKTFCKEKGYEPIREADLTALIFGRFDELEKEGYPGGAIFKGKMNGA